MRKDIIDALIAGSVVTAAFIALGIFYSFHMTAVVVRQPVVIDSQSCGQLCVRVKDYVQTLPREGGLK